MVAPQPERISPMPRTRPPLNMPNPYTGGATGERPIDQGSGSETSQQIPELHLHFTCNTTSAPQDTHFTSAKPVSMTFLAEANVARRLEDIVSALDEFPPDPAAFEQFRAAFLSTLRELEARREHREPYFGDLSMMIDIGVLNCEADTTTGDTMRILCDICNDLSRPLGPDDLSRARKLFRQAHLDFRPTLPETVDMDAIIRDFFS